jgi:hypothetical protein
VNVGQFERNVIVLPVTEEMLEDVRSWQAMRIDWGRAWREAEEERQFLATQLHPHREDYRRVMAPIWAAERRRSKVRASVTRATPRRVARPLRPGRYRKATT